MPVVLIGVSIDELKKRMPAGSKWVHHYEGPRGGDSRPETITVDRWLEPGEMSPDSDAPGFYFWGSRYGPGWIYVEGEPFAQEGFVKWSDGHGTWEFYEANA